MQHNSAQMCIPKANKATFWLKTDAIFCMQNPVTHTNQRYFQLYCYLIKISAKLYADLINLTEDFKHQEWETKNMAIQFQTHS